MDQRAPSPDDRQNVVMDQDPVDDASALVAQMFPRAGWAVLAGSVLTAQRTPGSDLDIVVVLPTDDPQAPQRISRHFRGWPVELFIHDDRTLNHYLAKEVPQRKPTLHRLVANGVALIGDPASWQVRCAGVLADGPPPLSAQERELGRYGLTDLLDDLVHAIDPGERSVIAVTAWTTAAEQMLAFADRWTGAGKWLLRELRDLDAELADRWLAAYPDLSSIEQVVREVLDRIGGPLFDGFHAVGVRPSAGEAS
jgi:hypothetical protein